MVLDRGTQDRTRPPNTLGATLDALASRLPEFTAATRDFLVDISTRTLAQRPELEGITLQP